MLCGNGVWSMRSYSGRYQRVTLPSPEELFGIRNSRIPGLIVRRGKIDQRLAKDRPHPDPSTLIGDRILVVIHVDEGRRAALDHLQAAKAGSPSNELLINIFRLCRKDV